MKTIPVIATLLAAVGTAHAQAPAVNSGGVVNTGSYSSAGVAPGSMVSIFGTNLASAVAIAPANVIPLPTKLGDVSSVTFNGIAAPLFFVSSAQINAQLPWNVLPAGTSSGNVNVVVTRSTGSSSPQSVKVVATDPGIYTITQNGLGQAIATDNADGSIAAPSGSIPGAKLPPHPIHVGDYLIIWCTGVGAAKSPVVNGGNTGGAIIDTVFQPTVVIGNVQAKPVYSVVSPEFVAVDQIGVQVSPNTPTGNNISIQIEVNGITTTSQATIAVEPGSTTSEFNYRNVSASFAHFIPNTSTLPGIPTHEFSSTDIRPEVGYQGGDFVNGVAIYPPWQVQPLAGGQGISGGWPMGVVLSYTPAKGPFSSNSSGQWQWFDLQSTAAYRSTCPSLDPGRDGVYCPVGFNSGIAVGNHYYLVPDAINQYPVFVEIDTTAPGGLGSDAAYSFFKGSSVGSAGWATGVYDGHYIYYAPTVFNGNIVRHDTTLDTSGISSNGWLNFDPSSSCASNPLLVNAKGYLGSAWDGHRYIYFAPSGSSNIIRYDTTQSFDSCSSYAAASAPATGFGGAIIALGGSTTNGQQYLYLVPWAVGHTNGSIQLSSQTVRILVGQFSNGSWNPVDFTSEAFEVFDLATLTSNLAWSSFGLGATTFSTGALAGESVVAGFQLGWINTHSGRQVVGFGANTAAVWVMHDPTKALTDVTGWTVVPVDPTMDTHNYGGPYDAVHQQLYPATPFARELLQITGL